MVGRTQIFNDTAGLKDKSSAITSYVERGDSGGREGSKKETIQPFNKTTPNQGYLPTLYRLPPTDMDFYKGDEK